MGVAWRKVVLRVAPRPASPAEGACGFEEVVGSVGEGGAALEPIDHVALVGFEQEFELGAEAGDALSQAGGFVDAVEVFHFGFEQLERGADGEVEIAGGFEELFAVGEGLAAVAARWAGRRRTCGRGREAAGWRRAAFRRLPCRAAGRRCRGPALQSEGWRRRGRSSWRRLLRARGLRRRRRRRLRAECRRRARRRPRCLTERSAKKRWWLTMMMSDSRARRRISVMKQRR